jgi:tetratricopeptide (TPR) repeat protein
MSRRLTALCACLVLVGGVAGATWWLTTPPSELDETQANLPVPPFPPRIAEGSTYETCLATLAGDPTGAVTLAETWQADGGGDGAMHCRGLALIASGKPSAGAALLEHLARQSTAPALARASVLSQAVQARLMVAQEDQPPPEPARAPATKTKADLAAVKGAPAEERGAPSTDRTAANDAAAKDRTAAAAATTDLAAVKNATADRTMANDVVAKDAATDAPTDPVAAAGQAAEDASLALSLSPSDTDLFVMRATAESLLGQFQDAVDDLSEALRLDARRPDALVLRAMMRRKLNQLDLAQADVSRALTLDPDDPDALLERGILRQRMGDEAGARADWEHARAVDPNSTTADLAEQNLSLLEAGPVQQ